MKKSILFTGLLFLLLSCEKGDQLSNNDTNLATRGFNEQTFTGNTIIIKNGAFSPSYLEVNINSTVVWTNDDNMVHTVTADNGRFNSGDIAPGGTFRHTFSTTGTYTYHCEHHSGENGTIMCAGIR